MRFETKREREQRRKRQKRSAILGMVFAMLVVVGLGVLLWNGKKNIEAKNVGYEKQIKELQAQVDVKERFEAMSVEERISFLHKLEGILPKQEWKGLFDFYDGIIGEQGGLSEENVKDKSYWLIRQFILGKSVNNFAEKNTKSGLFSKSEKNYYYQMQTALQIARTSYEREEVCLEEGSWDRIAFGADAFFDYLYHGLENDEKISIPLFSMMIPKKYDVQRKKQLYCHEELLLQQYVLNELLASSPEMNYERNIPAVRYRRGAGTYLTGYEYQDISEETLSYAYQIDMDVINGTTEIKNGMFRPFYDCWKEYVGYIQDGIEKMESETIYRVKLDIQGFYDNLSKFVVRNALYKSVQEALRYDKERFAVFGNDDENDNRAKRVVSWILDELFKVEYYDACTGELKEKTDSNQGIPQGPNLSAYAANVALFLVDQKVAKLLQEANAGCQEGKIRARYARYVDDMIIIASSPEILMKIKSEIASQLYDLGLNLSPKTEAEDGISKEEAGDWIISERGGFGVSAGFDLADDALLPNITEERYRQLFKDVKDANMNMIRVWGGGIYEDDAFYQAADENGILVWQDFIFACTTYPSDPAFMKRVEAEAEYNIKRLRNHASLAMWCGNNEIYEGMRYWGWDKKYTDPGIMEGMKQGYDKLFRELLPRKVAELDPDRFYMHGSPYEANWGRPESWKIADSHNWGIWYGQKPFESLDTEIPRFMSEFGFQAFPEMKTIATFASPEDYALESEVMNAHQKATIGNFLIKKTMGLYYKVPEDFDQLVYMGLVLQGVGVRQGLEAHRRNRPYCMGTLYWQLNDSWPVVSWSSIDYYGNWKALHYQAKRAFAPVLVDAVKEGEDLNIYVMSDKLEADKEVTLLLRVMDFNGKVLTKKSIKGEVPANASTLYYKEPYAGMTTSPQNTFLLMTLKNKKGEVLSEEIYYFNHAKDQELPKTEIRYKVKPMDGKYEVTLSARQLARDVFIEIPVQGARFTDNFFDLLPGQTKKVIITSDKLKKNEKVDITIKQLSDTN